jgi:5'-3' exonuclease
MNELNERINNHFKSNKLVIVSGSDQVGEGEHKIFQYIRNNPSNENTFIYGLDSDLIMLSINHLHICKNIYLFRETPNFVQFINPNLEPNKNYFLDIPELYNSIKNFMSNEITSNEINRVHDYILICFLLGNDFLPHFPALNIRTGGIDKILNAYKQVLGNTNNILTNGNIIYWDNFKQIIQYLANHENTYIINEHKLRNKMEYKTNFIDDDIQYFNSTPLFRRELEEYINPFKPKWQHRYYKALLTNNSNLIYDKKSISINYLEGIEWTLKYYTTGQIDWNWKYNYNYPPLLQDLVKYIPESNSHQFITEYNKNSINELTQLCYVLPVNSLHLIPTNLSNLLLNKHPEWYRFDCDFVWAYTRYFWEAHVEMNDINIEELSEIISSFNSSLNVENDTSTSLDK